MSRIKYNRRIFQSIDTFEKAYWVGFIVADGYILSTRPTFGIKLGQVDGEEHLSKFIRFIEGDLERQLKTEKHGITGNTIYKVMLYSKEVCADLQELGIQPNKSGKETLPKIDEKYYRDFIRGYWDGDGFIRKKSDGIGVVGSYEILSFIQEHFKKELGVLPQKIYEHGTIFKIEYRSKEDASKILSYLYREGDVALTRKVDLLY